MGDEIGMTRIDSTQDVILTRIVARLRDELELPATRCYETLTPLDEPPIPKGGDYFLTVSPGNGSFDVEMQSGGGVYQLMEMSSVTVTGYAMVALDPVDKETQVLHKVTRGTLPIKRAILKALAGHDLQDGDDNEMLRSFIYAIRAWNPQYNRDTKMARFAIAFGIDFDWDLS